MSLLNPAAAALASAPDTPIVDAVAPSPKPFVKWVGGKRRLVPELLRQAPRSFGRYHEPFVGGGALFFGLAESHDKDQYYSVRALSVDGMEDDADVAAWFIYLNKTGFNGLYRVNRRGLFNVPMGRYKNPNICDDENLRVCSRALAGVDIRHEGFDAVTERAEPGDFVYFDPPYVPVSDTANFTAYTRSGFGPAEQEKLRDVARRLKDNGVRVIVSNSDTAPVRSLYRRGFRQRQVLVGRAINSKATARGAVPELIIS
jgi:DNA adenine methylase